MNNKIVVFDVQREIAELKRRVEHLEHLEHRDNTPIELRKIGDWPPQPPLFGPHQYPPFCPPINCDWLRDFINSDNKGNTLD